VNPLEMGKYEKLVNPIFCKFLKNVKINFVKSYKCKKIENSENLKN